MGTAHFLPGKTTVLVMLFEFAWAPPLELLPLVAGGGH